MVHRLTGDAPRNLLIGPMWSLKKWEVLNADSNMKLSNLRAQTAKLKLLEMGISGDRIEAEGYGPPFPICEANDTDECKAQNRRIDVRVLSF